MNRGDLFKYVDRETDLGKVTSVEKGGGGFRKMDGKDDDCVGASRDSSGHNGSDGVQYLNESIFDIDFSGCQHCSPSYYHLPQNVSFLLFQFSFFIVLIFVFSYVWWIEEIWCKCGQSFL